MSTMLAPGSYDCTPCWPCLVISGSEESWKFGCVCMVISALVLRSDLHVVWGGGELGPLKTRPKAHPLCHGGAGSEDRSSDLG